LKKQNGNIDENQAQDAELRLVKNRIVDMNDKFDLLLYTLMHQGNLKLSRKKKNGEL
jgi:hypothetical protein